MATQGTVNCWPFWLHGMSRSMTWKNYSTEHCDQTVTDIMIRFAVFGSPHQGQANGWSIVGHYHHMENKGPWHGKTTPSKTVTRRWQIWWFGFPYLVACIKDNLKNSQLLVAVITWKVNIDDLEKLLHRALWPNGDRRDDSVLGVGILHHGQLK